MIHNSFIPPSDADDIKPKRETIERYFGRDYDNMARILFCPDADLAKGYRERFLSGKGGADRQCFTDMA